MVLDAFFNKLFVVLFLWRPGAVSWEVGGNLSTARSTYGDHVQPVATLSIDMQARFFIYFPAVLVTGGGNVG